MMKVLSILIMILVLVACCMAGALATHNAQAAENASNVSEEAQVWGDAVDGFQVRLSAPKRTWPYGETPRLTMEVRNQGTHTFRVPKPVEQACEFLEMNGTKYTRLSRKTWKSLDPLVPGRTLQGMVSLNDRWRVWKARGKRERRPLGMSPGEYAIRAICIAFEELSETRSRTIRPVSNVLEIVIEEALPGSQSSLADVVQKGVSFVAVCEATGPAAGASREAGVVWNSQDFKILDVLLGEISGRETLEIGYWQLFGDGERIIRKNEQVIWIGWASFSHVDDKAVPYWRGTKALLDSPENQRAVTEALKDHVPVGPASNGLQCRLLPTTQTVEIPEGADPLKTEVYVTYEVRNIGEKTVKFLPWKTPLDGEHNDPFEVIGPDGKRCPFVGSLVDRAPPGPEDFVVFGPGHMVRCRVRVRYDFTQPGVYRVSTTKTSGFAPDYWDMMAYYGADADKAKQNPDNVWTGTLKSNTVTVRIVRPRPATEDDARAFVAKVVHSYIDGKGEASFPIADEIVALDNGTVLSRQELQEAWPRFCKVAFKRKVTQEEYFQGVNLKVLSPGEAGVFKHEYLAGVYQSQEGDLFVDGSEVKEGVEDFIAYEKGFIFIIREVNGNWTLVAIGG